MKHPNAGRRVLLSPPNGTVVTLIFGSFFHLERSGGVRTAKAAGQSNLTHSLSMRPSVRPYAIAQIDPRL